MKISPLMATSAIRVDPVLSAPTLQAQRVVAPSRSRVVQVGTLPPGLSEASGLVTSERHPDLLWVHNDSDHVPLIHGLRADGTPQTTVKLADASHYDWEDIARVQIGGKTCLALCDVGDNLMERSDCAIHLVPEPDLSIGDQTLTAQDSVPFVYEDGPHDVEAVAADGDRLLLLSKRDRPPVLFELRLDGPKGAARVARRLGTVPSIPPPPVHAQWETGKRWKTQPTAMDIDPAGRRMVVLTYSQICLYERHSDESWLEALQRTPTVLPMPASQSQAEAVGFSPDGLAIYVTSEGEGAPIHRIDLS